MITMVLADERPAVRCGLRMWLALQPDLAIVGETDNPEELYALVREQQPDVVVLAELPGIDGPTAATTLRRLSPHSAVVMLSLRDDAALRTRAAAAGATLVCKHEACDTLLAVVRRAASEAQALRGETIV